MTANTKWNTPPRPGSRGGAGARGATGLHATCEPTVCERDGSRYEAVDVADPDDPAEVSCVGCAGMTRRLCRRLPACSPSNGRMDGRTIVWQLRKGGAADTDYAFAGIADWELASGTKASADFKTGWAMARATPATLRALAATAEKGGKS